MQGDTTVTMMTSSYDVIYNVTIPKEEKCIEENNLFTVGFIPFKLLAIFLNLTLLISALVDREKLRRQNYIFSCVMSTLLSNTVYLLLSIWITVDNYAQVAREPQFNEMTWEKNLWIFSEAITVSIVFGICANVTSLIYVTLDSVYFVGRSGTEWGTSAGNKKNMLSISGKSRVALMLVVISWLVPVLMTVVAFLWNCAKQCKCPSNNFQGEHCPSDSNCSRMWAPLKTPYLMVSVGLWFLQVIVLFYFLFHGIKQHYRSIEDPIGKIQNGGSTSRVEEDGCDVTDEIGTVKTMTSTQDNEPKPRSGNTGRRRSTFRRKFNSRLKFAITMAVLIVACSSPAAISIVLDSAVRDIPTSHLIIVSGVFVFIYVTVSPIIMWKFLPNLKTSFHKAWHGASSCSCVMSRDKAKRRSVTPPSSPSQ